MENDSIDFCNVDEAWWKLAIQPFVAGIVGYITNVVALKMMFYPLEFWGVKIKTFHEQPFGIIGWQGVLPCKMRKIAGRSVDLILERLLNVQEVFERLEPERFGEVMDRGLLLLVDKVIQETAEEYAPMVWNSLPQTVKDEIVVKASMESNSLFLQKFMKAMQENIDSVLDIRHMAVEACCANKAIMNNIFLEVGAKEFVFIEHSGFYFGFLFGIVQVTVYCFEPAIWVLPVFGFMVGWLTNWLALKVIFRPLEPTKVLGFTMHGIFLRRQQEVAETFSRVNCRQILHTKAIWDAILTGRLKRNFFNLLRAHSLAFTNDLLGGMRIFAIASLGAQNLNDMREAIAQKIIDGLPGIIDQSYEYTTEALDIENTLRERMAALSSSEFEGVLHPAFEEDELLLIIVGGALGALAGTAQLLLLF